MPASDATRIITVLCVIARADTLRLQLPSIWPRALPLTPSASGIFLAQAATLPLEPASELELDLAATIDVVCEGLRCNDDPFPDAGIERLYNFMVPQGRVALAPVPPKSGNQGFVTLEYFKDY